MKFSIISPSFLGSYHGAAKNREEKIVRMINSVLQQTFQDFELIIVSDGCEKTMEIVKPYVLEFMPKIRLIQIQKQPTWSGKVRNAGISKAIGDIITYVDIDDILGSNHLQIINDNFGDYDWVYADHLMYSMKQEKFVPYHTNIDVKGMCGTSSISHKRSLNALWINNGYEHDKVFIDTLKKISKNYGRIPQTEYMVAHAPHGVDY